MILKPLPDLDDKEKCAKLGRLYVLKDARLEAVKMIRDGLVALQSQYDKDQREGLSMCREAVERLERIGALEQEHA